jgi:methylated-DNA-[protein]-cysteine S-methyltransferase
MNRVHACAAFEEQVVGWVAGDRAAAPELDGECERCRELAGGMSRADAALRALRAPPAGLEQAHVALRRALAEAQAPLFYDRLDSPVGPLLLAASDRGLREVRYVARQGGALPERAVHAPERLAAAREQLEEYFAGRRDRFELPLDLGDVPPFEARVLGAAARIPFGEVRSYGELARAIGAPKAARAVGNALGRNPIPIVIPCHRVVRGSGALGGYGGGPGIKDRLLAIEGVLLAS